MMACMGASTQNIIGQINNLKLSLLSIHPMSFVSLFGHLLMIDVLVCCSHMKVYLMCDVLHLFPLDLCRLISSGSWPASPPSSLSRLLPDDMLGL